MAKSAMVLANELRNNYSTMIVPSLEQLGETVLCVGNGKYAIPCTNSENEDAWVLLSLTVPKGSRDGDPYDGYLEAEMYARHLREQQEKKEAAAKLKAEKQAERERKQAAKAKEKAPE